MTTTPAPLLLGLTGYPLGHSLSPVIQRAALAASGLAGSFALFPIPPAPGGLDALRELLDRIRSGEIRGLNVTIPHKEAVLPLLDRVSAAAQRIGAVNTIFMEGDDLTGENTDAPAFQRALENAFHLPPGRALVLGAGGSARAVVCALLDAGWEVRLAARRLDQAASLAAHFGLPEPATLPWPLSAASLEKSAPQLVVNTTPLGMTPNIETSPWPDGLAFPERACVYDLVYNPRETRLLRSAGEQGLRTADGLQMLVEQAALAFEIWTGRPAPHEAMAQAVAA